MLNDREIIARCEVQDMIDPYVKDQVKDIAGRSVISYGVSSYGYDIRLADEFRVFHNAYNSLVDPKQFDEKSFVQVKDNSIWIPPNSFALGRSLELINVPRDILVLCIGKSTYARCGIVVNVTPLEPEWRGHITIEISNTTPLPARIYANEGIAQLVFLKANEGCAISYADRKGKYQDQSGVTLAKYRAIVSIEFDDSDLDSFAEEFGLQDQKIDPIDALDGELDNMAIGSGTIEQLYIDGEMQMSKFGDLIDVKIFAHR